MGVSELKFESVKLINISGSTMLGVMVEAEGSLRFRGIVCAEAPDKKKFIDLFVALTTDEASTITVDNPQNTITVDMNAKQRLMFAGAHAEFVVAISMRDNELTKMALGRLI